MHSDKHNAIMAIATGLISSLFNVASCGDMSFHHCASWFYQSSPFISFVFHSFLLYSLGDDLCMVPTLWLQSETWVSAGVLHTLFFAWNIP